MAIQVCNLKLYDSVGGALGAHVDGHIRPKTAAEREGLDAVVHLDESGAVMTAEQQAERLEAARAYIEQCRDAGRHVRGPKAKPVGGFLLAGLPRYGDREAWKPFIPEAGELSRAELNQRQYQVSLDYTRKGLAWFKRRAGPGVIIAHCSLHQDELAPHLHVLFVMADTSGRLGWNRIGQRFGVEPGQPWTFDKRDPLYLHGGNLMHALQDRYHEEVASAFGLERGSTASTSTRQPIDRAKGLLLRAEEERAELERERGRHREQRRRTARRVRATRSRLRGATAAAGVELAAARAGLQAAAVKLDANGKRNTKLAADMAGACGERDQARTLLAVARTRETELQGDVERIEGARDAAQTALTAARTRESALQGDVERIEGERNEANSALQAARKRESALVADLAGTQSERDATNSALQAAWKRESDLAAAVKRVEGERNEVNRLGWAWKAEAGAWKAKAGAAAEVENRQAVVVRLGKNVRNLTEDLRKVRDERDERGRTITDRDYQIRTVTRERDKANSKLEAAAGREKGLSERVERLEADKKGLIQQFADLQQRVQKWIDDTIRPWIETVDAERVELHERLARAAAEPAAPRPAGQGADVAGRRPVVAGGHGDVTVPARPSLVMPGSVVPERSDRDGLGRRN